MGGLLTRLPVGATFAPRGAKASQGGFQTANASFFGLLSRITHILVTLSAVEVGPDQGWLPLAMQPSESLQVSCVLNFAQGPLHGSSVRPTGARSRSATPCRGDIWRQIVREVLFLRQQVCAGTTPTGPSDPTWSLPARLFIQSHVIK